VRGCEAFAARRLRDESNDVSTACTHPHTSHSQVCETYDILLDCMYDHVIGACGVDAMEMVFQMLGREVRRLTVDSVDCYLRRPVRPVKRTRII
jgi:hypothetical protein